MERNYFHDDNRSRGERPLWNSSRPDEESVSRNHRMRYGSEGPKVGKDMARPFPELRGAYYPKVPPLSPSGGDRYGEGRGADPRRGLSLPPEGRYGLRYSDDVRSHRDDTGSMFIPQNPTGRQDRSRTEPKNDDFESFRDISRNNLYFVEPRLRDLHHQTTRLPRERSSSANRDGQRDRVTFDDQRPRSHDALPSLLGRSQFDEPYRPPGGESPWGDAQLWSTQHMKRHSSLPSLGLHGNRLDPGLSKPYDGYRGDFPADGRLRGHYRGLWGETSHQDILGLRFLADPRKAESFIERFVESCIKESLILEVAAEVLVESRDLQDVVDRTSYPVILAAKDVLHDCINEELVAIAGEERQNAAIRYWKDIATRAELMEPVRDTVVMETVEDELRLVAADAVSEMVNDYFREKEVVIAFGVLYEEVSEHLLYGVVNESLLDLSLDDLFEELIDEEAREVAGVFVTDIYATGRPRLPSSDRAAESEYREIYERSAEHVADIVIMESLVENLKAQHQIWTDAEYKERALDGMILDQLLSESLMIQDSVETTQLNNPVKQFHDDTADETGMQFLLDELTPSLDDEMAKQDQVEVELARLMDTPSATP